MTKDNRTVPTSSDSETGLIYLRARYYDPYIGRFISEDPHWNLDNMIYGDKEYEDDEVKVPDAQAISQASNLYVYCINNPILYVDYTGCAVYIIGSGLSVQFGLRLGGSEGFIFDDNFNVGIIQTGSFGGGVDIGISGNTFLSIIDADTIYDIEGGSVEIGGSISPIKAWGLTFGGGYDMTVSTSDSSIKGSIYSLNAGLSVLPADLHAQISFSNVKGGWLNVLDFVLDKLLNIITPGL